MRHCEPVEGPPMDAHFEAIEVSQGFIARRDVLEVGLDDRFIRRQRALRLWVRIRKGAYCLIRTWEQLMGVKSLKQAVEIQSQYAKRVYDNHCQSLEKCVSAWRATRRNRVSFHSGGSR